MREVAPESLAKSPCGFASHCSNCRRRSCRDGGISIFILFAIAAAGCVISDLSSSSSSSSALFVVAKESEVKSLPLSHTKRSNIFKYESSSRVSKSSTPWWEVNLEDAGDDNDDDRHGTDPTEEDKLNLPVSFYCDNIASTGEFGDTLSSGVEPSTFMYDYNVVFDGDGGSTSAGRLMESEVLPLLEFSMINFIVQNMFLSGICPVLDETNSVTISIAQTYDYDGDGDGMTEVEIEGGDGNDKEKFTIVGGGIRRRVQTSNEMEMIGISSTPVDLISEDGSCLIATATDESCTPVEGRMSLYIASDDLSSENQEILTQDITNALKYAMEKDLLVDAHESVRKVVFVEKVKLQAPVIEDDGIEEEEEDIVNVVNGERGGLGSLVILGSVVSLMGVGAMMVGYKEVKRRREEEREKLTAVVNKMDFNKSNSGMMTAQNSGSALGDDDFVEVLDGNGDDVWHENAAVPLGSTSIHSA